MRGEIVKVFVVLKEGYEPSEFERKRDLIEKRKEKGLWLRAD
jgi:acyl-coenzyme A synthetase/AMP-(fatty) acid ligase